VDLCFWGARGGNWVRLAQKSFFGRWGLSGATTHPTGRRQRLWPGRQVGGLILVAGNRGQNRTDDWRRQSLFLLGGCWFLICFSPSSFVFLLFYTPAGIIP